MAIRNYRLIMALLIMSFVGILVIFSSIIIDNISPHIVYEAEELPSQSGQVVQDINASGGFYRFAAANESGAVVFGPYIRLPKGEYIASFRLNAPHDSTSEKVATLDICTHAGKIINNRTIIYSQDFENPGSYQSFVLPFRSDGESNFEFRVFKDMGGDLFVDSITIRPSKITSIYICVLLNVAKIVLSILLGLFLFMLIRRVRLETTRDKCTLLFVFTLCIYVITILGIFGPLHEITGDEPHYLITSYSIIHDHDIYVKNNYENDDYLEFYPHNGIRPHMATTLTGEWISSHEIGLSILLTIPYLLFGVLGVRLFLAVIAVLVVVNTFIFSKEMLVDEKTALMASLATAFISPLLFYSYSIYPEIVVSLILIYSTRVLYNTSVNKYVKAYKYVLCGIMIAFIPWLGIKYISLMLPLFLLFSIYLRKRTVNLISILLPILISSSLYAYYLLSAFGSLSPTVRYGKIATDIGAHLSVNRLLSPSHIASYFFDHQVGLIFHSPIYILSLIGLIIVILGVISGSKMKNEFGKFFILLVPSMSYFFMYSASISWGGWCPVSRPMVAILPIIIVLLSIGLSYASQKMIKTTVDGLCVLSLGISLILLKNHNILIQFDRGDLLTYEFPSPFVDISLIFPSFIARNSIDNWIYLTLWLMLLVIFATVEYIYRQRLRVVN